MANDYNNLPDEYRPISMWGYFGYEILFSIPIVGFIVLLVFSFGGTKNVNLRNFARSYFCFLIVIVIFAIIVAIISSRCCLLLIFAPEEIKKLRVFMHFAECPQFSYSYFSEAIRLPLHNYALK